MGWRVGKKQRLYDFLKCDLIYYLAVFNWANHFIFDYSAEFFGVAYDTGDFLFSWKWDSGIMDVFFRCSWDTAVIIINL